MRVFRPDVRRPAARSRSRLAWLVSAAALLCPACALELRSAATLQDLAPGLVAGATLERADPPAADPASDPERAPRQVVYTGVLRIAVSDPTAAADAARGLADSLGGWLQLLAGHQVTLRIPADRWSAVLERASALGRVLDRRLQSSDVTEQVVDLRLRLKNALALRDRLAAILDKADTVPAALQVETELARVRTEIEQMEGQLQVLERQVAFATLTLDFVQVQAAPRRSELPFAWLRDLGVGSLLSGGGS